MARPLQQNTCTRIMQSYELLRLFLPSPHCCFRSLIPHSRKHTPQTLLRICSPTYIHRVHSITIASEVTNKMLPHTFRRTLTHLVYREWSYCGRLTCARVGGQSAVRPECHTLVCVYILYIYEYIKWYCCCTHLSIQIICFTQAPTLSAVRLLRMAVALGTPERSEYSSHYTEETERSV